MYVDIYIYIYIIHLLVHDALLHHLAIYAIHVHVQSKYISSCSF